MMKMGRVPLTIAVLMTLGGCGIFGGNGKPKTPVLGNRTPILTSETDVALDPTIAGVQVLLPPAAPNAEWTQPGGNSAHSVGHVSLSAAPTRAWSVKIAAGSNRARLAAAPVVSGGKLFVVDVTGAVRAFAADTGAALWSVSVTEGTDNPAARFGGGVSVEGERLYAVDGIGTVAAINAADGSVIWRKKPGGPLRGSPSIGNGQVYVMSQDNQLMALSETDGTTVWSEAGSLQTSAVFGVATPAVAQGTIIAGFSSGELNAYRYENGRALWQDALSRTSISTSVSSLSDIDASPVVDQGRVYAVGQGGRMVALEVVTGQRIWEQNIASISTPLVAGEWVFVVTDDAKILCLARANGKVRWIGQLPRWRNEESKKGAINWVGPILAGDRLIALSSQGQIASVSPNDGSVTSTIETKDAFRLPPVVANGTMYVLGDSGQLAAYR